MVTIYQKLHQLEELYQKRKERNQEIEYKITAYQDLKKIIGDLEFELLFRESKMMIPIVFLPFVISRFFFLNEILSYILLIGTIVATFIGVKFNFKRTICKKIGLFKKSYAEYEELKQKESNQKKHIERLGQFLEITKLKEQYQFYELQAFQVQINEIAKSYNTSLEELEKDYQLRKKEIIEEKEQFLQHYEYTAEEMIFFEQIQEENGYDLQKKISNLKNRRS